MKNKSIRKVKVRRVKVKVEIRNSVDSSIGIWGINLEIRICLLEIF